MSGPFHDYLGRDAAGEGEADEGAAAGVGAYEGPFGAGLPDFLSCAVEGPGDGGVEAAELAEVLEVLVHLLVGDDGEGEASGVFLVGVSVEDGLCEAVEVYG